MGAESFFFTHSGGRLYGVLHTVEAEAQRGVGVVLVHPFMEERQDAHPVLRSLSESLAREGFPALRFDLTGNGDSSGEWSDGTVSRWCEDLSGACEQLRTSSGVGEVVLVGLRFGATLAGRCADSAGASGLVLIQPVVRGAQYAMDLLRANLAAELVLNKKAHITREGLIENLERGESVNLFGYDFTQAQWEGLKSLDLATELEKTSVPALLVEVVRSETATGSNELKRLGEALGARGTHRRAVEPQSLYTEGKRRVARAPEVERTVIEWISAQSVGASTRGARSPSVV